MADLRIVLRFWRRLSVMTAICVALLVAPVSMAWAACVDVASGDGDGIGGMGFDGGEDDGIGGMGIYGTITGFGSICLNGLRVEVPDHAVVAGPFGERSPETLRVGHVVSIDAEHADGSWVARSIALQPALAGPVTDGGSDAEVDFVLGVPVERASLRQPGSDGDHVAVYGVRGAGRRMSVTLVEREPRLDRAMVWGVVERPVDEAGETYAGGVAVEPGLAGPIPNGERAWVVGAWNPRTQRVDVSDWRTPAPLVPERPRRSLELTVERTEAGERALYLDGAHLALAEGTASASLDDVEAGERVIVEGEVDGRGLLHIESIRRPEKAGARGRGRGNVASSPGSPEGGNGDAPGRSGAAPAHSGALPSKASARAAERANLGAASQRGAAARVERPARANRPQRPDRVRPPERPGRFASDVRAARIVRPERPQRPERSARPERPERPDRPDRPERPERPDNSGRPDR